MEMQILEILKDVQKDLKEVKTDVHVLKTDVSELKTDVHVLKTDVDVLKVNLQKVQATVDRIEVAQTEDVIGILKVSKKKTDFEVDYLNNRLTEMDKRIYVLEKTIQN